MRFQTVPKLYIIHTTYVTFTVELVIFVSLNDMCQNFELTNVSN